MEEINQFEANKRSIFNDLPELTIQSIDFGLEDHDTLLQMSVTPEGIRKEYKENEEKLNSTFDPRMGASEYQCNYCYQKSGLCTGHPGHINFVNSCHELTSSTSQKDKIFVYVPTQVVNIHLLASSICMNSSCSAETRTILFQNVSGSLDMDKVEKYANISRLERLKILAEDTKKAKIGCRTCRKMPNDYDKTSMTKNFQMKKVINKVVSSLPDLPYQIFDSFNQITDQEAGFLGFKTFKLDGQTKLITHPRNMIMRSIYVIPPIHRPMIRSDNRPPDMHSFTRSYNEMVKILNNAKVGQSEKILNLQNAVNVLYLNKDKKGINNTTKQYTSINVYLQGRSGMLRNEMMGKRINYGGRTVIGPGPNLNFGEVGIPRVMTELLTVPEIITQENIVYYQNLFNNMKINYHYPIAGPHASHKMEVTPKYAYNRLLESGDKVDRQLQNGDIIIFNRQPTLHKYGMMAARVVIIDENIIRIPLCYTTMFCADFDGDEMNIHVPQTKEAIFEAENYMNVTKNLISNQTSTPAYGQVLDTILGSYLLSKSKNVPIDVLEKCNEALVRPKDLTAFYKKLNDKNISVSDGKAILSLIFPDDFTYNYGKVVISDGIMVSGILDKSAIGIGVNSLLVEIVKRYGQDIGSDFLTDNFKLVDVYNTYKGFSTSFQDIPLLGSKPEGLIKFIDDLLKKEKIDRKLLETKINDIKISLKSKELFDYLSEKDLTDERLRELLNFAKYDFLTLGEYKEKRVDELRDKIGATELPKTKNKVEIANYEKKVAGILNKTEVFLQKFQDGFLLPSNTLVSMTNSGAKGKGVNIGSMIGILGQQNFKGERLAATMHGNRVTPTDLVNDPDPESRGYCQRSLLDGLTPKEMFSHISASREGIIDIAVGVGETGYTQRRMMKSFEDIKVDNDGSVVTSDKRIIQFIYGDDGFSATSFRRVGIGSNTLLQPFNIKEIFNFLNDEESDEEADG